MLQHGLLKASFVPPVFERQMPELTRYRTALTNERSRTTQRLQKVLESANIKLSSVVSDICGVSARAILDQIAVGVTGPKLLASLAKGQQRRKRAEIEAVFRSLKSELDIRPIYHQKEDRIDAHIFIAFLAYCLQVTLKNRAMAYALGLTPLCRRELAS